MLNTRIRRGAAGVATTVAVAVTLIVWLSPGPAPQAPAATPRSASPQTANHPAPDSTGAHSTTPDVVTPDSATAVPPTPTRDPPAASGAGADSDDGPLGRTGPRPDGVPDQIGIFLGGDDGCAVEYEPGRPQILIPEAPVESPTHLGVCVVNLDAAAPVRVTLTPPTGSARTTVLPPNEPGNAGTFRTRFLLTPADPVGIYRVAAEQGAVTLATDVAVGPATSRTLVLDFPVEGVTPGVDVHLHLGGFPPGRPAAIHVYGSDRIATVQPYRTSLAVPVDARGAAHVVIPTSSASRGCYGFTTDVVHTCDVEGPCAVVDFCVTRD